MDTFLKYVIEKIKNINHNKKDADHALSMNALFIIFILSFSFGLLFFRLLFQLAPQFFFPNFTQSIFSARWHHWHTGILLILIGTMMLLMGAGMNIILGFLGVGLGFAIDAFIPSFYIEMTRKDQLYEYRRSLIPTLAFASVIILVIYILSLIYY